MRELKVSLRDNRPDLVYMIGIEVRQGRGRYSMTKIVTLTARYQIHNKSSYRLQFAQKCFASTVVSTHSFIKIFFERINLIPLHLCTM